MKTALVEMQFHEKTGVRSQFVEMPYVTETMLGAQLFAEFKRLGSVRPDRVILDLDVKKTCNVT